MLDGFSVIPLNEETEAILVRFVTISSLFLVVSITVSKVGSDKSGRLIECLIISFESLTTATGSAC